MPRLVPKIIKNENIPRPVDTVKLIDELQKRIENLEEQLRRKEESQQQ